MFIFRILYWEMVQEKPKSNFNIVDFSGYPYQQPPQYVPRDYMRNPPPPSESGPPYQDPYSGYAAPDRPYQAPHSNPPFSYPHHHDRGRHGAYSGPPPPPQPYPSQREGLVRMSPAPLDVPPSSVGQANSFYHPEPSARDRYPPDGYYNPGAQPPPMRAYVRVSHVPGLSLYMDISLGIP